jgi:hypothetical protein
MTTRAESRLAGKGASIAHRLVILARGMRLAEFEHPEQWRWDEPGVEGVHAEKEKRCQPFLVPTVTASIGCQW